MKELIGRTVTGLLMDAEHQQYIVFETTTGILPYRTESECCSSTWFNDIIGVQALLGGTVTSVEEVPTTGEDVGSCEYVQTYGFKIITDKGYVDIVFRNSSNGYYGGEVVAYSGYEKALADPENEWVKDTVAITDDWTA